MECSIIIPTQNRSERLQASLEALNRQTAIGAFEVIVVDDGSIASQQKVLNILAVRYLLTWCRRRRTCSSFTAGAARNAGLAASRGRISLFLDDDMVVPPDFVERHLELHAGAQDITVIGLRSRVPYRKWSGLGLSITFNKLKRLAIPDPRLQCISQELWSRAPWAYANSANLSTSYATLRSVGMFDKQFVGWGFEDTDLAYRLYRAGSQFVLDRVSIPIHLNSQDTLDEEPDLLPESKLRELLANARRLTRKYANDTFLVDLVMTECIRRVTASAGLGPKHNDGDSEAVDSYGNFAKRLSLLST